MKNRIIFPAIILLALFTLSTKCEKEQASPEKSNLAELQVNLDQTAWFCLDNCRYNFTFLEGSVTTRRYNAPNDENPLWTCTRSLSQSDWQSLLGALDLNTLAQTEATIGCPGCADEPVETLLVKQADFSHEVRMNVQAEVPAIQGLLDELRGLAENYKSQENCQ